ncbi:MAG: homoserine kinase [Sporocytophaga sp.]|uniref:homoserine kinase n=1 Tax=Sporocytophaga sp. TaxID=2231183 RepID=UPI001B08324B|nr:homoserine kinase [Sporocytophaga sp.]MBO9699792.1 homoserine kinase [Sporocytophaga sp.]
MKDSIKVFAPATVANVACGFDVLGFAVENPGDEVVLTKKSTPGVKITTITGDEGRLTKDADKNTVGVAVSRFLNHLQSDAGIEITLHKKMPLGSGLGSSAASAVAGVFAVNQLLGMPLNQQELLPFAMEGERIACGSAHADNVAPSLLGGFVLIRSYDPLDVIKIPTPANLYSTIIHPQVEVQTKDAREILKKQIPLRDAVTQWGNVGGLIAGLMLSDYQLIGRSMKDVIVEPIRAILIPGFEDVKQAALSAGALGCGISGSGPSIFALSTSEEIAHKVGNEMQKVLNSINIGSEVYISKINNSGPQILD